MVRGSRLDSRRRGDKMIVAWLKGNGQTRSTISSKPGFDRSVKEKTRGEVNFHSRV